MSKIAIVTDSNSGISQEQGNKLGIYVLPMPFQIGDKTFFEDIDLTQEEFYEKLKEGSDISTSQPSPEDVMNLWDRLLKEYDEVVHMPMSSSLSSSCETAHMLSMEYNGKVHVVNNQRISVTQRQAALDAKTMAEKGKSAEEIKHYLEKVKLDASIYITLDTLYYLKKGGRITPAAAALGTFLKIKPVLQIQGEKLDSFAKARTIKQAKSIMFQAVKKDIEDRFQSIDNVWLQIAYTYNLEAANQMKEELSLEFPNCPIHVDPLSLSVACHIGPGALAIACTKKLDESIF